MAKLSKETAEKHYRILLELHNFEYLTLAQKVSVFYDNLEHDILKEITGEKEYFEQLKWLKDNQIRIERNIKTGEIPKVIISDIDNLKNWRNEGVHENNMPEPKYKSHFHTMAQIICFFSDVNIPVEIMDIIEGGLNPPKLNAVNSNQSNKNKKSDKKSKRTDKDEKFKKISKSEAIQIINKDFHLQLNGGNTVYANINKSAPVWWFDIPNNRFDNDINMVLYHHIKKKLYHFFIKGGSIKTLRENFYQRDDDRYTNTSDIKIGVNDEYFTDKRGFQFLKYLQNETNYSEG